MLTRLHSGKRRQLRRKVPIFGYMDFKIKPGPAAADPWPKNTKWDGQ